MGSVRILSLWEGVRDGGDILTSEQLAARSLEIRRRASQRTKEYYDTHRLEGNTYHRGYYHRMMTLGLASFITTLRARVKRRRDADIAAKDILLRAL